MQRCKIGKDDLILLPDLWHEIPLYKARELYKFCRTSMPKEVQLRYELLSKCDNPRDAEDMLIQWLEDNKDKSFSDFYLKCINILADKPFPNNVASDSIDYLYSSFVDLIVYGLLYDGCTHEAQKIVSFEHNGKCYDLPKDKQLFDLTITMEGITMAQFSEFSDLINLIHSQPNGFDYMATAIAVLCVPEDTEYDEDVVRDTAKEFEDLPMDIVWDVFFYSGHLCDTSEGHIVTYSQEKARVAKPLVEWDGEEIYLISPKIVEVFSKFPLLSN